MAVKLINFFCSRVYDEREREWKYKKRLLCSTQGKGHKIIYAVINLDHIWKRQACDFLNTFHISRSNDIWSFVSGMDLRRFDCEWKSETLKTIYFNQLLADFQLFKSISRQFNKTNLHFFELRLTSDRQKTDWQNLSILNW